MSSKNSMRLPAVTLAAIHVITMAAPITAFADAPPAPGVNAANNNTQVYLAPNGVPVVNIANPNSAGLSHNQYTQFNVDSRGVVLNNGTVDRVSRSSQLAGQTLANLNLGSAAKVILNEVVSPNRSVLAGYTEVLGSKADVIVANPFGITCSGCGFVNTDHVALTTGTANFKDSGALAGFTVNGGDVLVSGAGLNGTNQTYFDIVTRSLKVDGQLNAHTLNVVTGTNDWDYETGNATPIDGTGSGPTLAFDSTALGGVYADRIRIISTEAGVGVRMVGDAAASADDFSIDAAGKIELTGRISTQRDLSVRYFGVPAGAGSGDVGTPPAGPADAITFSGVNASLNAGRDLTLAAGLGGVTLVDGSLAANGALTVTGSALEDSSSSAATRFGRGNVFLGIQNAAHIVGTSWGAGDALTGVIGSLTLGSASTALYSGANTDSTQPDLALIATNGNIDVGSASVKSPGTVSLSAQQGGITIGAGSNAVQAGGNLALAATTSIDNAGSVLAGQYLAVQSGASGHALEVTNSGRLQAGTALFMGSPGFRVNLNNAADGVLLADTMQLTADAISNAGLIQATHYTYIDANTFANTTAAATLLASTAAGGMDFLNVSGTLDNAGNIRSGEVLELSAGTVTNRSGAAISAANVLSVQASTALANSGAMNAGTLLNINGPSVSNDGRLQADGQVVISQLPAAPVGSGTLNNSASGTILGDTLTVATGALTNSGVIQATNGTTITAASLANQTAGAKILTSTNASGTAALTVSGNVDNAGAIFGAGNLSVHAGAINNAATAGLSSLRTLALTSTTDITNTGSIYAGTQLNVTSGGTFNNVGDATGFGGTVSSGIPGSGLGGMTFNVDSFINTGTVLAEGVIQISARDFKNDPVGGVPTVIDDAPVMTFEATPRKDCGFPLGSSTCPSFFQVGTAYVHPAADLIGASGGFHCDAFGNNCAYSFVWQATYTVDQHLSSGTLPKAAQLLAGGDLDLTYTGSARNVASVMSGNNINIIAAGPTATAFENNDLHLSHEVFHKLFWERYGDSGHIYFAPLNETQYDGVIPDDDEPGAAAGWTQYADELSAVAAGYGKLFSAAPTGSFTGGLYARNSINLPGLINRGTAPPVSVSTTVPQGVSGSAAQIPTAASLQGLSLALPTSPNGFFVPSQNPGSGYLIETNPLYTSGSALGSDYLARLLGYDVDTLQKRLGDANYEDKLIRDQLVAQTGSNILGGYASETAEVKGLMESAASQSGTLGLTFGKALTPAQAASLKQDLVWMEEKDVGGQKVLVPVVYLAATTRESVAKGAVISASNVSVKGDSLTNEGGTIKADKQLTVETTGDIVNRSGTISGGTVDLKAGGNVVNDTTAQTRGNDYVGQTDVGNTAVITAKDGLTIDAAKNVTVKGAEVRSGGSASITAGGNVVIDTIENRAADKKSVAQGNGDTSTQTRSVTQIGSSVDAGGNVNIRSGGTTTLGGSQINAGGDAKVQAAGDLNVIDRQSSSTVQTRTETSGWTTDSTSVGHTNSSVDTVSTQTTSVGSSIKSGGSTTLEAGKTATIRGSDVAAGGDLNVSGKNINVLAGQDTTLDSRHEESTRSAIGGHADANSVGWDISHETKSSDTTTTTSTARTSTLKAGGNVTRTAIDTITDVGTQIDAGGNVTQNAKTIDSRAAENTSTTTKSSHSEKESIGPSIDYGVGDAIDDAKNGSSAGAADASGGPTVGNTAKYTKNSSNSSSSSSTAVTSRIKAGGNVKSTSTQDTTLEGTQIESGGNTDIGARALNVKAAHDTTSSSGSSEKIEASVRGEIDSTGSPGGKISGEYATTDSQSASSTAHAGSIKSGGNVTVRTTGDTRLEGTTVQSKGDTTIDAGGNVVMDAARTTASSSGSNSDIKGSVSVGKSYGGVSGSVDTGSNSSSSSQAVTGSVDAGGNLTVHSGKDVKLEGTDLSAGKDAKVSADGKVQATDAVSTSESQSESFSASGSVSGSKGSKGARPAPSKDGDAIVGGGGVSSSSNATSTTTKKKTTVKAKGDATVEGKGGTQLNGADVKSGVQTPAGGSAPK